MSLTHGFYTETYNLDWANCPGNGQSWAGEHCQCFCWHVVLGKGHHRMTGGWVSSQLAWADEAKNCQGVHLSRLFNLRLCIYRMSGRRHKPMWWTGPEGLTSFFLPINYKRGFWFLNSVAHVWIHMFKKQKAVLFGLRSLSADAISLKLLYHLVLEVEIYK